MKIAHLKQSVNFCIFSLIVPFSRIIEMFNKFVRNIFILLMISGNSFGLGRKRFWQKMIFCGNFLLLAFCYVRGAGKRKRSSRKHRRGLKSRWPKTRSNSNFKNFLESTAILKKAKILETSQLLTFGKDASRLSTYYGCEQQTAQEKMGSATVRSSQGKSAYQCSRDGLYFCEIFCKKMKKSR